MFPYAVLPESKKPISELLLSPSFNQDVSHEYEEADAEGEKQKHQLVIPYAELSDQSKPNAKLNSTEFLKAYLAEKDCKIELSTRAKKIIQMRIIWQREVVDQDSLYEGVQMWLLSMQRYR